MENQKNKTKKAIIPVLSSAVSRPSCHLSVTQLHHFLSIFNLVDVLITSESIPCNPPALPVRVASWVVKSLQVFMNCNFLNHFSRSRLRLFLVLCVREPLPVLSSSWSILPERASLGRQSWRGEGRSIYSMYFLVFGILNRVLPIQNKEIKRQTREHAS